MAGGVDQVQHVILTIIRGVFDQHRVGLDGNATLAFDIHAVEQLRLHVPFLDGPGLLDQAVSERGFPVVDMCDDREIADMFEVCHEWGN